MENPVKFAFQLVSPGCAEGSLSLREAVIHFRINNTSNPLFDLLSGLSNIILNPCHIWGEENQAWIEWFNDESAIRLVLSTSDGEHLQVIISKLNDIFDDSQSHTVIDGKCLMIQFILAIVRELDFFIKKTGLLNYSQQWQKDEFPLTSLLYLKKYLIDRGVWVPVPVKENTLCEELELLVG